MEYKVITISEKYECTTKNKLEEIVNEHIGDGWKPLGGVSVSRSDWYLFQKCVMTQAMIKE